MTDHEYHEAFRAAIVRCAMEILRDKDEREIAQSMRGLRANGKDWAVFIFREALRDLKGIDGR